MAHNSRRDTIEGKPPELMAQLIKQEANHAKKDELDFVKLGGARARSPSRTQRADTVEALPFPPPPHTHAPPTPLPSPTVVLDPPQHTKATSPLSWSSSSIPSLGDVPRVPRVTPGTRSPREVPEIKEIPPTTQTVVADMVPRPSPGPKRRSEAYREPEPLEEEMGRNRKREMLPTFQNAESSRRISMVIKKSSHEENMRKMLKRVSTTVLVRKDWNTAHFPQLVRFGDAFSRILPEDADEADFMQRNRIGKETFKYLRQTHRMLRWGVVREGIIKKLENSKFVSALPIGTSVGSHDGNIEIRAIREEMAQCITEPLNLELLLKQSISSGGVGGAMVIPDAKRLKGTLKALREQDMEAQPTSSRSSSSDEEDGYGDARHLNADWNDLFAKLDAYVRVSTLPVSGAGLKALSAGQFTGPSSEEIVLQNTLERLFVALAVHRYELPEYYDNPESRGDDSYYKRLQRSVICPMLWDLTLYLKLIVRPEWDDYCRESPVKDLPCLCSLTYKTRPYSALLVDHYCTGVKMQAKDPLKLDQDEEGTQTMMAHKAFLKLIISMRLRLDWLVAHTKTDEEFDKLKLYGLYIKQDLSCHIVCLRPLRNKIAGSGQPSVMYSLSEMEPLRLVKLIEDQKAQIQVGDVMKLLNYIVAIINERVPWLKPLEPRRVRVDKSSVFSFDNVQPNHQTVRFPPDPDALPEDEISSNVEQPYYQSWRRHVTDHADFFFPGKVSDEDQAIRVAKTICLQQGITIDYPIKEFNGNAIVFKAKTNADSHLLRNIDVAVIVKKRTYERRHEAPLLASYKDHPNIVTLHYWTNESRWTVLVEDWLEPGARHRGNTGDVLMSADNRAFEALHMTVCLINALVVLYESATCHRDIKPDNVAYCSRMKQWQLFDFDLATRIPVGKRLYLQDVGTDGFIAPEVAVVQANGYGLPCDVYSLGLTIKDMYQADLLEWRNAYIETQPHPNAASAIWGLIFEAINGMLVEDQFKRPNPYEIWEFLTGEEHPFLAPVPSHTHQLRALCHRHFHDVQ